MHRVTVTLFVLSALIYLTSALPLDLGNGGVYDDEAANSYWAARFGDGFLSLLRSHQKKVVLQKPRTVKQNKFVRVVKRPRTSAPTTTTTTTTTTPLPLPAEEPQTFMSAMNVESFNGNDLLTDYVYYYDDYPTENSVLV